MLVTQIRPFFATQRMDSAMQELYVASAGSAMNAGSTANACLVTPTHFICGNAGDTRCVLFTGGAPVPLSTDHKPTLDAERKRIQKAGGIVSGGRVNGCLAVSRAMGDFVSSNHTIPSTFECFAARRSSSSGLI